MRQIWSTIVTSMADRIPDGVTTSFRISKMLTTTTEFVLWDWYRSAEGQQIMSTIMNRNTQRRKVFGLLERPSFPPQLLPDEFQYKIFVSGKSGVGKTSTIARLTANEVPKTHAETVGISTSVLYWPARICDINKVVMFQLQFWDAGENTIHKFDHILPACKDKADAVMFLFSFTDKSSFNDVPQQMTRVLSPDDNKCQFVIGTKLDLHARSEVTQQDVQTFESQWQLPIIPAKNLTDQSDFRNDLQEVAPLLNYICDQLWMRDQVLAGKMPARPYSGPPPSFTTT